MIPAMWGKVTGFWTQFSIDFKCSCMTEIALLSLLGTAAILKELDLDFGLEV